MQRFLFLLLTLTLAACSPKYPIPKEIRQDQEEHLERSQQRAPGGPDFELDPIEQQPVAAPRALVNKGNWGYYALEVDKNYQAIVDRAKVPVDFFIFDTSGDYIDINLAPVTKDGMQFTGEPLLGKNKHSHHVAGIIAGKKEGTRNIGIASPLRENDLLGLWPYKVLTNAGSGYYSQIIDGAEHALGVSEKLIEQGHKVVWNFSLGGGGGSSRLNDVFQEATEAGIIVVVASSGNTGKEGVLYPAKLNTTVAIGATDDRDRQAYFSTWGTELEFVAPGQSIYSVLLDGNRGLLSGTSMAAPHFAAVLGVLASVYPEASPAELIAHVRKYSKDLGKSGWDNKYGHGIPRLTPLLENPISGIPDDPTPPDPDPDPEPEEPEYDYPKTTYNIQHPGTFQVRWRTKTQSKNDAPFNTTTFELSTYIKEGMSLTEAQEVTTALVDRVRKRGYLVPDYAQDDHIVKWAHLFFSLDARSRGYDMGFHQAKILLPDGSNLLLHEFDFDRRPRKRDIKKAGVLSYERKENTP